MKTLESPMNTTLISTSEETEKNGHELGTLHLKVACLPIPPYAQPGRYNAISFMTGKRF
jgi:hypothetical protein